MRLPATASVLVLLAATAAPGAVVTVSDCANDPHIVVSVPNNATRIDLGNDDLVLACALSPRPGTARVVITAHDVTIQGPAGSLSATTDGTAIDVSATGKFTASKTSIESSGTNSNLRIVAVGDMLFDSSSVDEGASTTGDKLTIGCTGSAPDCKITAIDTTFESRVMEITAVGDIVFSLARVVSHSPRDDVSLTSTHGNIDLSGAGAGGGNPSPSCAQACAGNTFVSGHEGNLEIAAFGKVDLRTANILVAENIIVTSGVGIGPATVPATINASDASIRNDFAKDGEIVMTADEGQSTIDITDAIIVDDNEPGVGEDVAELNGCEVTPRTSPPCTNIVGTPDVDS